MEKTVYLDNAATTYPKPKEVLSAWEHASLAAGGNPGRSGHRLSMRAAETVYHARSAVADLFGSKNPEHVVFTYNATYALNIAIHALVQRGDHVLISNLEHNAVYRPIDALARKGIITYDTFDAYGKETEVLCRLSEKLRPNTRLVVTLHRSNVCNITLPIERIGSLLAARGIAYVVDASQSAGHCQIHVEDSGITALCAPGHKGLYGPTGTGFVLFASNAEEAVVKCPPLLSGGNGIHSREPYMPELLPERFEAGTLAAPALAALTAGIKVIEGIGISNLAKRECALCKHALSRLLHSKRVRVYAPNEQNGSVILFGIRDLPSDRVAELLDAAGICVRSGLHCAPLAHTRLGTPEDGAVRVSFGMYNTQRDVDALCDVLETI